MISKRPDLLVAKPAARAYFLRLASNKGGNMFLELLFSSDLEGLEALVCEYCAYTAEWGNCLQTCANAAKWQALYLLLKKFPAASVTRTYQGPIGAHERVMPSVVDICKQKGCTDRRILALLETAKKREKAEADRARSAALEAERRKREDSSEAAATTPLPSADAAGLSTAAFEDPGMKAITAKEAKAKERKKAQKKKARAKKRAEAKANGGAGKQAEESSDSGEDSAEEGMDEEERMMHRAPAFDLERAKKERAEAAAQHARSKK
jgi:hypothetical protein